MRIKQRLKRLEEVHKPDKAIKLLDIESWNRGLDTLAEALECNRGELDKVLEGLQDENKTAISQT